MIHILCLFSKNNKILHFLIQICIIFYIIINTVFIIVNNIGILLRSNRMCIEILKKSLLCDSISIINRFYEIHLTVILLSLKHFEVIIVQFNYFMYLNTFLLYFLQKSILIFIDQTFLHKICWVLTYIDLINLINFLINATIIAWMTIRIQHFLFFWFNTNSIFNLNLNCLLIHWLLLSNLIDVQYIVIWLTITIFC